MKGWVQLFMFHRDAYDCTIWYCVIYWTVFIFFCWYSSLKGACIGNTTLIGIHCLEHIGKQHSWVNNMSNSIWQEMLNIFLPHSTPTYVLTLNLDLANYSDLKQCLLKDTYKPLKTEYPQWIIKDCLCKFSTSTILVLCLLFPLLWSSIYSQHPLLRSSVYSQHPLLSLSPTTSKLNKLDAIQPCTSFHAIFPPFNHACFWPQYFPFLISISFSLDSTNGS